jgi:hypothetical protein
MDKTVLKIIGVTLAIVSGILMWPASEAFMREEIPLTETWSFAASIAALGSAIAVFAAVAGKPK